MATIKKKAKPASRKKPPTKRKTGRPSIWTEETLHELGRELVAFCQRDDVWHLSKFSLTRGRTEKWLYSIREEHPIFSDYIDAANREIGNKMMNAGMTKSPCMWLLKTFMGRQLGEQEYINSVQEHEELIKAKAKIKALKDEKDELKIILEDFMAEREKHE